MIAATSKPPLLYCDIFCRVIDNFGDVGVTLRLARQLAQEYNFIVRLVVDDAKTYAAIGASPPLNLTVCNWQDVQFPPVFMADDALIIGISGHISKPGVEAPEVPTQAKLLVIEAFGCALPESYIKALAVQYGNDTPHAHQLSWLNLEYLSAETWVESHHLLPSPHPQLPLTKTFFFPGFTAGTCGLLREQDLLMRRDKFWTDTGDVADSDATVHQAPKQQFLIDLGVPPALCEHALMVFLFCYENAALAALLQAWQQSARPIVVLLPAERTHKAVCAALGLQPDELNIGVPLQRGTLTLITTPLLPQTEFDKLLWACDVNFVRGEDSIVRAHWAAKPFCWQVYVQDDGAHLIKLEAFLQQFLAGSSPQIAAIVRALFIAWNRQDSDAIGQAWLDFYANLPAIKMAVEARITGLYSQSDCAKNIVNWVNNAHT